MAQQKILIVDDTHDHLVLLRRLLQAVGYRVVEASHTAEALRKARTERPDLILAALSLPGQPAWEAARALGADPLLGRIPILGTTVYSTLLTAARVRALGCADYLEKPFNVDDLLYRIERLLPSAAPYAT